MEEIREALQRVKARDFSTSGHGQQQQRRTPVGPEFTPTLLPKIEARNQCWALNAAHLASNRIIAHEHGEPHATSFDMLRTQVLQSMDAKEWKFLGITSPTSNCGKTVTAVNLALSIGRQPERSVLLCDLDLRKPHVGKCLGLKPKNGVLSVLENRSPLADAIVEVGIGDCRTMVLPTEAPTSRSSDRMASRAMSEMLQEIKQEFESHIIIVDLPPLLVSDDVLAVLPKLDCVVLVTAVGITTPAEINQSTKHLLSTEVVRLVVNKVQPSKSKYYY
jgi:Mrp family chromosome partitioning ATPase